MNVHTQSRTASACAPATSANSDLPSEDPILQARMRRINRRLFVMSGKGGVGKSTVAVNLAVALAQMGRRVGLLDVDVHGPSVPTLLMVADSRVLTEDGMFLPVPVGDRLKVMSLGFLVASGNDAIVWRGPRKFSVIRQLLRDVQWGDLDDLVVDCPPGTGDEPLAVVQLAGVPSAAVIVTTPQVVAVADVRRCVAFCKMLDLPVAGIIENMSGIICPICGQAFDLFGRGGGELLARETGIPFLGSIPLDPAIVRDGDAGVPFISEGKNAPAIQAFSAIVEKLLPATSGS